MPGSPVLVYRISDERESTDRERKEQIRNMRLLATVDAYNLDGGLGTTLYLNLSFSHILRSYYRARSAKNKVKIEMRVGLVLI